MSTWAEGLLGHVPTYVALQRLIGADRLRLRCFQELELQPGDRVLDVGCGPAYYFDHLPQVRYFGLDTSKACIRHARRLYGDRAEFRCEQFSERHLTELPEMDAVMMLGLLHHLSDEEARAVMRLAARILAPRGRVISVDTCFEPGQGRVSRWMSKHDRGQYVREPEAFLALAREAFGEVRGEVLTNLTRVPGSFWMMCMKAPVLVRDDSL